MELNLHSPIHLLTLVLNNAHDAFMAWCLINHRGKFTFTFLRKEGQKEHSRTYTSVFSKGDSNYKQRLA